MNSNSSVWKTILTVVIVLVSIVRIAMMCNKSSRSSYSDNSYNDVSSLMSQNFKGQKASESADDAASNSLFYESYDSISHLSDSEKDNYSVVKLKKDSLIMLDVFSKINVESGSYFQKNYDDTLSLAIKQTDDTSIFLHSFDTKNDLMTNFNAIKKKFDIKNLDLKLDDKESKFVSYNYQKNGKKTKGYALLAADQGHFTALEIESNRLSENELQGKAFTLIAQIAK
ncbi:hypothetical protein ASG31_11120 [Chryseobacterium sp. Leaf404]|uniref:hypothetical protein n=1 Tax=unclassified Chryseobacterium TaxID=2593645 RepID=UPI0006FEB090|nr:MULTISPECIES: hypothetical protein [unclassified Chryseobacterium]KQT16915.1 hypothetical protein ASG31_11120 [Chryseobacterium sp. Leaf404]